MRRKRVIIHIGFPKTGTSALQTWLSANVRTLANNGIDYPYPESQPTIDLGSGTGNIVQILFRDGFFDRYQPAGAEFASAARLIRLCGEPLAERLGRICEDSPMPIVMFSGEVMSAMDEKGWRTVAGLADRFDLQIIAFARDPFDYLYSAWRQRAKMNGSDMVPFEKFVRGRSEGELGHSMFRGFHNANAVGLPVTLLNYDTFRSDIIGAFFEAAGLERPRDTDFELKPSGFNDSLTGPEATLLEVVDSTLRNRDFSKTVMLLLAARTKSERFEPKFYSRDLHAHALDRYAAVIADMNSVIIGGRLSTEVRDEPPTDITLTRSEVAALLNALRLASGTGKDDSWRAPRRLRLSLPRPGLPLDFNSDAYLLLNPDVAGSGTDPGQHYRRHGRRELRRYKLS